MTTKSITRLCIYFFCLFIYGLTHTQQAPLTLTPEDQKMLAELDNEINSFVDSLPPEQQQQFWKDVEELTDTMSKMKPEELDNFIQGVFSGEITELPTKEEPKPAPKPQPVKPVQPAKPIEKKDKPVETVYLPEIKKAIETIETVIDQIETFLRKTQIIPKIESKIEKWAQQDHITPWQKDKTWSKFKAEIEEFVQKLYKAKDRDPKTKQYNYIATIVTNKALINNLEQLARALKQKIVQIQPPEFGQTKLSKSSRIAIQRVGSMISQALFMTKIPEELDAVFSGFSSVAEQRKIEEEKARQAALSGQRPITPSPIVGGSQAPYYGTYDTPGIYGQGGPEYAPSQPTSIPTIPKRPSRPQTPKAPGKPTKKAEKEETKKPQGKGPVKQAKSEKDSVAEGYLDEVIDNLEKAVDLIEEYDATLKNIKKHLIDNKDVKADVALFSLPQAIKATRKATDKIKALKRRVDRLENNIQKKKYRESLKKQKTRKQLATLETLGNDIKTIKDNWDKLEKSIPSNKQYAYIGGRGIAEASDTVKQLIATPSSIYELQRDIEKLIEAVQELEKLPIKK